MRSRLPLSAHQLFHTRDVDQARELVARVFCPHGLSPAGQAAALDARHHSARLGTEVSLNYVQYGPGVLIEPGDLQDFYLLQIPLRGRAHIRWGGHAFCSDPSLASLPSPGQELWMHWEDDSPHLIVKMSRRAVLNQWEQLSQHSLNGSALVFQPGVALQQPALRQVLGLVHHLCQVLEPPSGLAHPVLAEQAQQHLISSLLLAQPHSLSQAMDSQPPGQRLMPWTVRRARDFLHDNAGAALSLADICRHVGVSARTLQHAFVSHLGRSPMAYLRDVRLDLVRQRLSSPTARGLSVTEVAMDHGFLHMGHFAAHYRRRFGEQPQDTLRRSR